ncbi:MAG TPA: ABC transporter permease [Methanocorpusculum sp.]|nr:ABC transporter permease [Methanocorpusculum sp.]
MTHSARSHTLSRIATQILTGGLIFLFLVFISVPLVSLFTRVSIGDLFYAITSEAAINALTLSVITAVISTIVVIIFGTPLAYVNARIPYRGRNIVDTLTDLPIVLPPTVAGLALLMAFGANGLLGQYFSIFGIRIAFTTAAVVLAQIFVASPFYLRQARSSFESIDVEYEYASRTLGAGPVKTLFKVT